ncbi:MAG: nuclear transport factor 2 family protein [Acidimicrobiales bacterium]|nr:nuclear transport factor 2 family protein [Acidimicrobiales bacterium]
MDSATAITNLLHRYAELFDAGNHEACADLFAHARIVLDPNAPLVVDRDGLLDVWRSIVILHEEGTPRTQHVVTNPILDIDEVAGTATCRSAYTVLQQVDDGPLQTVAAGRYHDRFERVDGEWRFSERDYSRLDLVGDVGRHLRSIPRP